MSKAKLNEKIIETLCKDYQCLWLVNVEDYSIHIYSDNHPVRFPQSVEVVSAMKNYEEARRWYINNCVSDNDKTRLLELTTTENILKKTKNGEPFFVEYNRSLNGKINFNQLTYSRIVDDETGKEYILLGFRDIDIRKQVEIDDLTGVYTRPAFFKKADAKLKENPDVAYDILITDIQDFKKLNETYGIARADEILRWLGSFFSPMITDDVLIGRYGGDQMVILAPNKDFPSERKEQLRQDLLKAITENDLPSINMKFGLYENIPHDKPLVSSCDKAHIALNSVKTRYDKSIAHYDDTFRMELEIRRKIEDSMHASLKSHDFKVYYQPKHEASTNRLVGAEALIRWNHPEHGFMSPGDFIPLFEKNGFIIETDAYVWKRTCENLKKWEDMGIKTVPISVNASKLTLEQKDIVELIQIPVMENNIDPRKLHLEITETLMYKDNDELIRKLQTIKALGHEIELDDFGTGYSSINILSTLPLDIVKLDMSFMQHFDEEKKKKILAACIALAKDLGYKTISEGVEEQAQHDALTKYGVDIIQGYYYSKPLPEDEFEKYLIAHKQH